MPRPSRPCPFKVGQRVRHRISHRLATVTRVIHPKVITVRYDDNGEKGVYMAVAFNPAGR